MQRVTKFVRYLPEFGWNCSVLTVTNPSVPVFDDSLLAEIPASTQVCRTRTLEPGYAFKKTVSAGSAPVANPGPFRRAAALSKRLVRHAANAVLQPDAQILWYPTALRQGLRLLAADPHDAIFVTAPPFSTFLLGAALSRRTGLPLIADYRDEWGISNRYQENRQKSRLSFLLQRHMQRRVLRQASAVVATTSLSAENLKEETRAAGSHAAVASIYNGFDRADIDRVTRAGGEDETPAPDNRLRLAYVGTLWNLTSIQPVVQALHSLRASAPDIPARVELVIAGRTTAEQDQLLDSVAPTGCRVVREGYVDHARALRIMRSADAQCLLLSDVPEAARVVPAKTFEYIALKRPILSITRRGEVSRILENCPFAASFTPDDTAGIAAYIQQRVEQKCLAGIPTDPAISCEPTDSWSPEQFERQHQAGELADLLNHVTGRAGTAPKASSDTPSHPTCRAAAVAVTTMDGTGGSS